jgi:hypothetical protein
MTRAAEILRRSQACFREFGQSHGRNPIEQRGLLILSYVLWETAIELDVQERSTAPANERASSEIDTLI